MAKVKATKSEVTYTLELSAREAAALCEVLVCVDSEAGEGGILDELYDELGKAGAESPYLSHALDVLGIRIYTGDDS